MKPCGRALLACTACTLSLALPARALAQTVQSAVPAAAEAASAAPAASPESRGFMGHFVQDSFNDFRKFPSSDTATWLGVGAALAFMGHSMDRPVDSAMSTSALDAPLKAGSALGSYQVQLGSSFATYAIGHLTGNTKIANLGSDLLRAQLLAKTVTVALKTSVQRTRPDGTPWSFPSGHTSGAFAAATVLQKHFGWKAGVPAYAMASYVAASRIQDRRHFLSDVAFGAAIGIVAGRTVTIGRGDRRLAIAPMAAPGGAGISFSLVTR